MEASGDQGGQATQQTTMDNSQVDGASTITSDHQDAQITVKSNDEAIREATNTDNTWFSSLDPNHQEYVSKKGFKDSRSVLESYINLEKLRGVPEDRLLKLPEAEDDPKWDDVYQRLGKPQSPEDYDLKDSEDGTDKEFNEWARNTFHDLNLTKDQAKGIIERFDKLTEEKQQAMSESYEARVQEQEANLKKEWGAAFDQNLHQSKMAAQEFGLTNDVINTLEKAMGYDGVMKFVHGLSQKIGESKYVSGDEAMNPNAKLSPSQAQSRIESLKQDKEFVTKYLSGDVKAREEMARLHSFVSPEF